MVVWMNFASDGMPSTVVVSSIYRDSHHSRRHLESHLEPTETDQFLSKHTTTRTPLARLFFLCTIDHLPQRQFTTPHTGLGYYTTTVVRTSINLVSLVLFIVLA